MDLAAFAKHLEDKHVSKLTIKNYLADIRKFGRFIEQQTKTTFRFSDFTGENIAAFKASLNEQKTPLSSQERYLSSLRKYATYLHEEKIIPFNPFSFISPATENIDIWSISDFKKELMSSKASQLTTKNYVLDIKQFTTWLEEVHKNSSEDINPQTITTGMVEEYRTRLLEEMGLSPLSVNRKLSSIRKYISFLVSSEQITKEPLVLNATTNIDQNISEDSGDRIHSFAETSSPALHTSKEETTVDLHTDISDKAEEAHDTRDTSNGYSSFAPIRLSQKIKALLRLGFDFILVTPIVAGIEKTHLLLRKTQGQQGLFGEGKNMNTRLLSGFSRIKIQGGNHLASSPFHHFLTSDPRIAFKGKITNLSKAFYAPLDISTSDMPRHKKVIHHLRYTRPDWYKKYHTYPITHYFHFAILMIFITVIGASMYSVFFDSGRKAPALAALPTAPPRILSFQGRLTDASNNPIETYKNVRFAIYDDITATGSGNLLWQELLGVTPDQDGVFSVLLGNTGTTCADPLDPATAACSIPSTLFSENTTLYLGITIENDTELTPRQQVASVAYAINSETLQGLPPSTAAGAGQSNVVLALDSSGNLTIGGSATPTFQASGGQFTLSGTVLKLSTTASSNTDIQLAPDGSGKIDLQKAIINSTLNGPLPTAAGAVQIDDLFAVNATSSGQSAFTLNQDSTGPLISASASGVEKFTVTNTGGGYFASSVGIGSTNPGATLDVVGSLKASGAITFSSFSNNGGVLYTNASGVVAQTAVGSNGECLQSIGGGTPTWGTCGSGGTWTIGSGVIYPINTTLDLLLGGTATSSAKIGLININSGNPTATLSGNFSLSSPTGSAPTVTQNVLNGGTLNFRTSVGGDAGLSSRLFIANNGNIGIGSTSPAFRLDLSSTAGNGLRVGRYELDGPTGPGEILAVGNDLRLRSTTANVIIDSVSGGAIRLGTSNGNVGIGSTTPTAKLDVTGDASTSGSLVFNGSNKSIDVLNGSRLDVATSVGGDAGLSTKLTLLNNGNLGIGSTSPAYLFDVSGGSGIVGQFSGRVIGADAVNSNEFATLGQIAGGAGQYWQLNSGALSPSNSTFDVLVGASATSSAKIRLNATTGDLLALGRIYGENLVRNGSFENPGNWSYAAGGSRISTDAYVGSFSGKSTTNLGEDDLLQANIQVEPSSTYSYSGYFKSDTPGSPFGNGFVTFRLFDSAGVEITTAISGWTYGASFGYYKTQTVPSTWTAFTHTLVTPSNAYRMQLGMSYRGTASGATNPGTYVLYDAIKVEYGGTATKYAEAGDLQQVLNNQYAENDFTVNSGNLYVTSGNIGVGTTNPQEKLHIMGDARIISDSDVTTSLNSGAFHITNTAGTAGLSFDTNEIQSVGADLSLNFDNATNTTINNNLFVRTTGNVGIGTTTPGASLDVAGNLLVNNGGTIDTRAAGTLGIGTATQTGLTLGRSGAATTINSSALTLGQFTTNGGLLYTNGSGVVSQTGAGTANQVLHGGTIPSYSAVSLTADVSGTLPIANGGTNSTATPTNGGVAYGTGTAYAFTSAGTSGQVLQSNGAAAPTWIDPSALSTSYWNLASGALFAKNGTVDLLIGGSATASAKFGFINVNSGNPTATISGNLAIATPTGSAPANTYSVLNGGTINFQTSVGGDAGLTSRLFIANNGNIGIGTTTSSSKLDIQSPAVNTDVQRWMAFDGSRLGRFTETSGGAGWFEVDNASGVAQVLLRGDGGSSYVLTGNFGIGTSTPGQELDVNGDILVGAGSTIDARTAGTITIGGTTQTGLTLGRSGAATTINSSALTLGQFTTNGGLLYTNGSGVVSQTGAGTSTQVLHGGTTPSYGAVVLTTDVSGTLPIANGGTNSTATPTNGGIAYGTGTAYAFSSAGTSGQVLLSGGAGAPSWSNTNTSAFGLFDLSSGAIYPKNATTDLLIGGNATTSAKFGFINVNSGNPTATISGNLAIATPTGSGPANTYTVLNGGSINLRTSVGGDAGATSRLYIANNGNIGIGTSNPIHTTEVIGDGLIGGNVGIEISGTTIRGGTSASGIAADYNLVINANSLGGTLALQAASTTQVLLDANTGNLGLAGVTNPSSFRVQSGGSIGPNSNNAYDLGSTSLQWRNIYASGSICFAGGTDCATTFNNLQNYWNLTSGTLQPKNTTLDLLIGGNATTSAKFGFINVNSGTPTATISGNFGLQVPTGSAPAVSQNILNGGTFAIKTSVGGDAGLATRFTILNNGNIGIGSSTPTQALDVVGNITANGTTGLTLTGTGSGITFATGTGNHDITASAGTLRLGAATLTGTITGGNQNITGTGNISATSGSNTITGYGTIGTSGTTAFTGSTLALTGAATGATSYNGLVITANTGVITTGTWNGTAIGAQYGGTGINTSASTGVPSISSGTWSVAATLATSLGGLGANVTAAGAGEILYSSGTTTYGHLAAGTSGQVLLSGGAGAPSWSNTNTSAFGLFDLSSGSIYPKNATTDLLIGGNASSSARIAFLNINTGNPTASLSGNLSISSPTGSAPSTNFLVLNGGSFNFNTSVGGGSGTTRLSIGNTGILTASAYTANGGLLYTNGSGVISQTTVGSNGQCLQSIGGGAPTWGSCGGASYWTASNGLLYPTNATLDLAIGGTSSSAAKFVFSNVNSGTPTFRAYDSGSSNYISINHDGTDANITTSNGLINIGSGGGTTYFNTDIQNDSTNYSGFVKVSDKLLVQAATEASKNALVIFDNTLPGDIFTASASGDTKFVIDGSGNVGIGTKNPSSAKLEIVSGNILLDNNQSFQTKESGGTVRSILTYNSSNNLALTNANSTGNILFQTGASSTERVRIDSLGNVGIGTTTIPSLLTVSGATTGNSLITFNQTTSNADIFTASASGTTRFRLTNGGSVYAADFYDINNFGYFLDPAGTVVSASISGELKTDWGGISLGDPATNGSSITTYAGAGKGNFLTNTGSLISAFGSIGRGENYLRYSEQLDQNGGTDAAPWIKSSTLSISANNTSGPDGTTTAEALTGGASTNTIAQQYHGGTGIVASNNWTFSIWLKNNNTTGTVNISVTDGTSTVTTPINMSDNATKGWQRYFVTISAGGSASQITSTIDLNGNNTKILYAWGAQLEKQSTVGAYVRTSSARQTSTLKGLIAASTGPSVIMSGNDGIATPSASTLLVAGAGGVYGSSTDQNILQIYNNSTGATNNDVSIGFLGNRPGNVGNIPTQLASISAIMTNATGNAYTGELAFSTAGTAAAPSERLRITSTGNIGIGTSTPTSLLTVAGAGGTTTSGIKNILELRNTDANATNNQTGIGFFANRPTVSSGNILTPIASISAVMSTNSGSAWVGDLVFSSAASGAVSAEKMRLTGAGNLGIGSTTAGEKLDVNGNILVAAGGSIDVRAAGTLTIGGTTQTGLTLGRTGQSTTIAANTLTLNGVSTVTASSLATFTTAASLAMSSTTTLTLGSNATINGGSAANDDLTLQGTSNATRTSSYVILQPTAGNVGIGTTAPAGILDVNGKLTVLSGGNVGIGSTTPGSLLDVNGKLNVLSGGNVGIGSTAPQGLLDVGSSLTVLSGGNVGVGTSTPGRQFSARVQVDGGSPFSFINPTTTNSGSGVILVGIGVSASSTNDARWMKFYSSCTGDSYAGCTGKGSIHMNGSGNIVYDQSSADYGEWFQMGDDASLGDIVAQSNNKGVKAQGPHKLLGVISNNSGIVGNSRGVDGSGAPGPDYQIVGLLGQIVTKVSTVNGPIKNGDVITASQIPGFGEKAIKAGQIVGAALEDFDPNSSQAIACPAGTNPSVKCGKIMLYVSPSWYDPEVYITNAGDLNISGSNGNYVATNQGNITSRMGAFATAAIAQLKAGMITVTQLTAQALNVTGTLTTQSLAIASSNMTIAGQSINDFIDERVNALLDTRISQLTSPLASTSATVTAGKIVIKSEIATTAPVLEVQGNASISGTLATNGLSASTATVSGQLSATGLSAQDATISGTLRATNIEADNLTALAAQVATLSATTIVNNYTTTIASASSQIATPSADFIASLYSSGIQTDFASIASLSAQQAFVPSLSSDFFTANQGLIALGPTSLADTSVVGQLSVDGSLFLSENSINVFGTDLQIQPLQQGGVQFEGGKIAFDTDGNIRVDGNAVFGKDVYVAGTVSSKYISALPDSDLEINLPGGDTKLAVKNASGSAVFELNQVGNVIASGSGQFKDLLANSLNIVRGAQADDSLIETSASGSAGTAIIKAHQTERTINTPYVTSKSLIYITATSDTQGVTPYVARQTAEDPDGLLGNGPTAGSFTIQIPSSVSKDIKLNWWIVN